MWQAEQAYRESLPVIEAMAKKAGMEEVERDEIIQRVAIVLVEKAEEYDPLKGTTRMWALGIAHHVLLDALRAAREERRRIDPDTELEEIPTDALTPEQTLGARESLALLTGAVRKEHRRVFELDALEHTATEISRLLGMPRSTAEWRLQEAREDVDRELERIGEDRKSATCVRGVVVPPFLPAENAGPPPSPSGVSRWVMGAIRLGAATPSLAAAMVAGLALLTLAAWLTLVAAGRGSVPPLAPAAASIPAASTGRSPAVVQPPLPPDLQASATASNGDRRSRAVEGSIPKSRAPIFSSGPAGSTPPPRRAARRKWMLLTAVLSRFREISRAR